MVEIGMPYSDPIADGPVIQESNLVALRNGMTIDTLFAQLGALKDRVHIPVILMGYLNPILQYGIENFCAAAHRVGVSGIIIPDLPMYEFNIEYKKWFDNYELRFIFLVSPVTDKKRMQLADKLSSGFLYAVSSNSVTGAAGQSFNHDYFEKLRKAKLKNPIMIGFGISNKESFDMACSYANGAIIGSAYIKALKGSDTISSATQTFVHAILG
jgi:tryptophan synthase alpha chain